MSVQDIPDAVLGQIFRDEWIEAITSADPTDQTATLRSWDESIARFIALIRDSTFWEYDITSDLRKLMGEDHFATLTHTGIVRFKLMKVMVADEVYIEIGEMVDANGDSPTEEMVKFLEDAGTDFHRAFAKATIRLMRKHGMAQGNSKAERGPLAETFRMVLKEVIEDEIEEEVDSFRQSLMAEVTAANFVPWGPPKGGEQHDLPAPGGDQHGNEGPQHEA